MGARVAIIHFTVRSRSDERRGSELGLPTLDLVLLGSLRWLLDTITQPVHGHLT